MNYNEYLFSCLLKIYDKEFEQMEYDLQFEKIAQRYLGFTQSKFDVDTKSEYDCIIDYLEDKYIKYFDVHVFYSRTDGFSVPIKINTSEIDTDDDAVIEYAISIGRLDRDDADHVNYVEEVELDDYIGMNGLTLDKQYEQYQGK
jgi:hypothetical protein